MVIEDDPHIADLVDLYLRRDGFRVLLARDGEQGLASSNQEDPWIVVLDVGLPGELDGFDVCRRIRAKGNTPGPVPDGPRRRGGPNPRARARSGRLSGQAVLTPGAGRPGTRHPSPHAGDSAAPQEVVSVGDLEVDIRRREARRRSARRLR